MCAKDFLILSCLVTCKLFITKLKLGDKNDVPNNDMEISLHL